MPKSDRSLLLPSPNISALIPRIRSFFLTILILFMASLCLLVTRNEHIVSSVFISRQISLLACNRITVLLQIILLLKSIPLCFLCLWFAFQMPVPISLHSDITYNCKSVSSSDWMHRSVHRNFGFFPYCPSISKPLCSVCRIYPFIPSINVMQVSHLSSTLL